MKKRITWTLEDVAHFVIYRELDRLKVPYPYEEALRICKELREVVSFRTEKKSK